MLVIKVNNPMGESNQPVMMLRLREASARDPRIRIIEEQYSYEQVLTLYAACDAYVSLHRSEGFRAGPHRSHGPRQTRDRHGMVGQHDLHELAQFMSGRLSADTREGHPSRVFEAPARPGRGMGRS